MGRPPDRPEEPLADLISSSPRNTEARCHGGPGFRATFLDDTWLSRSSGLRVEDQPDYYYGRWVAEAYRHTTHDRAPRLEDVDAIICTPRLGRSRVRYTRLIVPMQMPSGKPCLLGASLIDTGIDLRAAAEAR